MRTNTPPHADINPDDDYELDAAQAADFDGNLEAESDDELVYIGDADEVLDRWEAEANAEADNDDDEFLQPIDEDDDDAEGDANFHEPSRDDAQLTFTGHSASVFCGSLHPHLPLAVTGGEDDHAYVWSTTDASVVHAITNHTDSIIAATFSADGNYLAIGDMAGEVEVLKVTQEYKRVWSFSMGDMVWMHWHPGTNVLLAGGQSGEVYVWRIPSGDCKVLAGSGEQAECGQLTADGKRLVVGYGDGSVRLWDLKSSTCVQFIETDQQLSHQDQVTCIAADPENGTFLTGSQDGTILIGCASGATGQLRPGAGAVEQLAFCGESDLRLVAIGTLEGNVQLWDVGKQAVRVECERSDASGVTRLAWAPGHNLLCGTLSGVVKVFDGRSGALKRTLEGHRADIYDMVYDKQKGLLLTTSNDNTAKLYTDVLV